MKNICLHEYRNDGFIYDATRMIGWNLSQPEYAIPAWTSAIAEQDPSIYQIAEHLPVDPWLVNNTALTSSWHDSFHDRLLDHIHGGNPNTLTLMNQVVLFQKLTIRLKVVSRNKKPVLRCMQLTSMKKLKKERLIL